MSLPSSPACNRDCQKQGMSTSTDAARYASGPPREAWHDMNMWVALISFTILETDGGRFHAQGAPRRACQIRTSARGWPTKDSPSRWLASRDGRKKDKRTETLAPATRTCHIGLRRFLRTEP